jgi:hypothetical protein
MRGVRVLASLSGALAVVGVAQVALSGAGQAVSQAGFALEEMVALPEMTLSELYARMHPLAVAEHTTSDVVAIPPGLASLEGLTVPPQTRAAEPANVTPAPRKPEVQAPPSKSRPEDARKLVIEKRAVGYASVALQLVDDRSDVRGEKLYPLPGALVRLVGTEDVASADARGVVRMSDLPALSRFLVTIEDPMGRVRPSVAELVVGAPQKDGEESPVQRVRLLRQLVVDTYYEVLRLPMESNAATLCGTIVGEDGLTYQSDVSVSLDSQRSRPLYFNDIGIMEPLRAVTSANGQFCAFNVEPGPAALTVSRAGVPLKTVVLMAFANRHGDQVISLKPSASWSLEFASMPPARSVLESAETRVDLSLLSALPVYPFGSSEPLSSDLTRSFVLSAERGGFQMGRQYLFGQAAEFEETVFAVDDWSHEAFAARATLTILPRGFVTDMALLAQTSQQEGMGTVVVQHVSLIGQGNDGISVRLMNEQGQSMGDGWYFAEKPAHRAIFFNVPPGNYFVLIETGGQYWLAGQTTVVYGDMVSMVQTGSVLTTSRP